MPKIKTARCDNTESDSAKEKKEGGPLERQRAFIRQRSAVLRPREDSTGLQDSQPGQDSHPEGADQPAPPPDSRKQAVSEYRKRQKAARSKKQS
jgi:hypothetical protein